MEIPTATAAAAPMPAEEATLRKQAEALEAFLFAELLRVADTGPPSPLGGRASQFDSFLRRTQAEAVAASGQTGLAEAIYRSMQRALGPGVSDS
ncbi:hypothetical protein [Jannaschia marina]|uniref:hypothetical protein n=1 Tax=Jannaschia marina TaxID=2741674 RepID=UPI0015C6E223|nr:hypothetical protein [Jannaschia marina]